ncbi:MAG: hypothetical protein LJE96_09330 [Deltaproteobacteria bacterium]|jgi:predicted AAA+ superfamily ATPase|nr:hypothetical protein [Deltaproteobacteria bacterium]
MWVKRRLKNRILQMTASRPALLLTGARQTGKTSLLQRLFPKVAALFGNTFHIEKALAQNINETKVIRQKNYRMYNPLYSNIDFFEQT